MASTLTVRLERLEHGLVLYYLPIVYIIGTIGNLINAGIFCHRTFRVTGCSWYFVCVSFVHLCMLNTSCLSQIIIKISNYNAFAHVISLCKLSSYVDVLLLVLSRNFLCLICIDRWMVTSSRAYRRQQSSPRIVFSTIVITSFIWILFSMHSLMGFTIIPGIVCYTSRSYVLFYSIYNIVIAVVPLTCMIVFSLLTLINVRRVARRTRPVLAASRSDSTQIRQARKKRDHQFIRLSICQVAFYLLLNSVRTITPFLTYWKIIVFVSIGDERAIVYFIYFIGLYLLYTYIAVSFSLSLCQPASFSYDISARQIKSIDLFRQHGSFIRWLRAPIDRRVLPCVNADGALFCVDSIKWNIRHE
jgi:hypothetical protein